MYYTNLNVLLLSVYHRLLIISCDQDKNTLTCLNANCCVRKRLCVHMIQFICNITNMPENKRESDVYFLQIEEISEYF